MSASQLSSGLTIINALKGFAAVSLTEFETSAETAIASGSVVEVSGAFFQWDADETPSGWSSISTASTAYIAVTPFGAAGSQTLSAAYTSTAPTWRDDNQGWYASAGSNTRYVGGVYKNGTSSYVGKYTFTIRPGAATIAGEDGPVLCTIIVSSVSTDQTHDPFLVTEPIMVYLEFNTVSSNDASDSYIRLQQRIGSSWQFALGYTYSSDEGIYIASLSKYSNLLLSLLVKLVIALL